MEQFRFLKSFDGTESNHSKGEFGFIYSTQFFIYFLVQNFEVFNLLSLIILVLLGSLFEMKGKKKEKEKMDKIYVWGN